jgi:hypothetical protein
VSINDDTDTEALDALLFRLADRILADLIAQGISVDDAVMCAVAAIAAQSLARRLCELESEWVAAQKAVDGAAVPVVTEKPPPENLE